jgi:hypothetical protein
MKTPAFLYTNLRSLISRRCRRQWRAGASNAVTVAGDYDKTAI